LLEKIPMKNYERFRKKKFYFVKRRGKLQIVCKLRLKKEEKIKIIRQKNDF
jgi:hypothetical protein